MKTQILQKKENRGRKAEDRATTGGPVGVASSGGETPSEAGLGTLQRKLDTSPSVESSRQMGDQLNQGSSAVAQRSLAENMSSLTAGEGVVQGNKFDKAIQGLKARSKKMPRYGYKSTYRPDTNPELHASPGKRTGGKPMPKPLFRSFPQGHGGDYDKEKNRLRLNKNLSDFGLGVNSAHEFSHPMNAYLPKYQDFDEDPEQFILDEIQSEWRGMVTATDQFESGLMPKNEEDLEELSSALDVKENPYAVFELMKSDRGYMKKLEILMENSGDEEADPVALTEKLASQMQISHFDDQKIFDQYTAEYNAKHEAAKREAAKREAEKPNKSEEQAPKKGFKTYKKKGGQHKGGGSRRIH